MKTLFGFGTVVALALSAVACSHDYAEASSTLEVTGRVDTQLRALDNASAVAVGSDGRTYSSYIQTNGSFRLSLPVGNVYRILFANSTMAGELRTIGHLVNATSSGKSDELAVKEGGKLDIGAVRPAGSGSAGGVKTATCGCDDLGSGKGDPAADPKGDTGKGDVGKGDTGKGDVGKGDVSKDGADDDLTKGDDDWKTKPKDADKDRLCDDDTDVELEAEHGPGDTCAKGGSDKAAPKITKKACVSKDLDKDGKDDDGYDKSGSADKPSADTSCTCSSECGAGSSCAASKCSSDDGGSSSKPTGK
jgi:hypothetical protein